MRTELEDLLRRGPASIRASLPRARRPLRADDVHWHGVAEAAASRARELLDTGDHVEGIAWARCSIEIYEVLAEECEGSHSFDVSAMYLRAAAIRVCGQRPGDRLLDPELIVTWVRAALLWSIPDARARTEMVLAAQDSSVEAIALRRAKNRLNVLAVLAAFVDVDDELKAWVGVRQQLL